MVNYCARFCSNDGHALHYLLPPSIIPQQNTTISALQYHHTTDCYLHVQATLPMPILLLDYYKDWLINKSPYTINSCIRTLINQPIFIWIRQKPIHTHRHTSSSYFIWKDTCIVHSNIHIHTHACTKPRPPGIPIQEFPGIPGNPPRLKFPAGIPGNYWILGENFWEFIKFPILVIFLLSNYC